MVGFVDVPTNPPRIGERMISSIGAGDLQLTERADVPKQRTGRADRLSERRKRPPIFEYLGERTLRIDT